MLAVLWEDVPLPAKETTFWAWPSQMAQAVIAAAPAEKGELGPFASTIAGLVGREKAADLLADIASDTANSRAWAYWFPADAKVQTAETIWEALEIRSFKLEEGCEEGVPSRQFRSLCAIARSPSKKPLADDAAASFYARERFAQAHEAMKQLAVMATRNLSSAPSPHVEGVLDSVRFRAELFDQEVFSTSAMSCANLSSALVSLTLPQGCRSLEAGIYVAMLEEDIGALVAICAAGCSPAVSAELCFFRRPQEEDEAPRLLPVEPRLAGRSCGVLTRLRKLRPFYHKLAKREGSMPSGQLQRQVEVDILAASQRLWPQASKRLTPREDAQRLKESRRTASLPYHVVMGEILEFVELCDLPSWAASRGLHEAASRRAKEAVMEEAMIL